MGHFCPLGSGSGFRIGIPDTDPMTRLNPDPIRIRNTDYCTDRLYRSVATILIVSIDLRRRRWRSSAAPPAPAIHSPPLLPLPSQLRRRHPIFWTCSVNSNALLDFRNRQCCGYPGSRIQQQRQKRKGEKISCPTFFYSHKCEYF
jgi:hypothetical protein